MLNKEIYDKMTKLLKDIMKYDGDISTETLNACYIVYEDTIERGNIDRDKLEYYIQVDKNKGTETARHFEVSTGHIYNLIKRFKCFFSTYILFIEKGFTEGDTVPLSLCDACDRLNLKHVKSMDKLHSIVNLSTRRAQRVLIQHITGSSIFMDVSVYELKSILETFNEDMYSENILTVKRELYDAVCKYISLLEGKMDGEERTEYIKDLGDLDFLHLSPAKVYAMTQHFELLNMKLTPYRLKEYIESKGELWYEGLRNFGPSVAVTIENKLKEYFEYSVFKRFYDSISGGDTTLTVVKAEETPEEPSVSKYKCAADLIQRDLKDIVYSLSKIQEIDISIHDIEAILNDTPIMTTAKQVMFVVNVVKSLELLASGNNTMTAANVMKLHNTYTYGIMPCKCKIDSSLTYRLKHISKSKLRIEEDLNYLLLYIFRNELFNTDKSAMTLLLVNKLLIIADIGLCVIPEDKVDEFNRLVESNDAAGLTRLCLNNVRYI